MLQTAQVWPESIAGWLTMASVALGIAYSIRRSGKMEGTLVEQINGLGKRVNDVEIDQGKAEERVRGLENIAERFETKVGILIERLLESRQEADKRIARYEEGVKGFTAEMYALRNDIGEDFQEVRKDLSSVQTRLALVEEAIKNQNPRGTRK